VSLSNLPPPIRLFLDAAEANDRDALLATLADGVILVDGATSDSGSAARARLGEMSAGRLRAIDQGRRGDEIVVTMLTIERGSDGQHAEAQYDWHFAVKADRIAAIRIESRPTASLLPTVASFVRAVNVPDLDRLLATFADDALVNDQLHDHWGKQAIRGWAEREIFGQRLALHVVGVTEHHGHAVVTANVNGTFDRRGLPDPLVLSFYFSLQDDRIVQLIILPTQPDTEAA
jgi:hypothetical protein